MTVRGPSTHRQDKGKRVRRTLVRGKSDRSRGDAVLVPRGLPGMDVFKEAVQTNLREGVKRRGTVHWPALEEIRDNACKNNLLIAQVLVGEQCEVDQFATWCNSSTEHIAVVTLTKQANRGGSDMNDCVQQAETNTLHDMFLQDGGHQDRIKIIEKAIAGSGSKLKTAVAAAVKDHFVLSIFDDTYILIHKWLIAFMRWVEWDAGPSASRFGTLRFEFHAYRQQCLEYVVGLVSIADGTDERKLYANLA